MKLFMLLSFLLFFSCKKKEELVPVDKLTATINLNGTNYTIDPQTITVGRFTVPILGTPYISVAGWTSLYSKLSLTLPDIPQTGTHDLSGYYSASYYHEATSTSFSGSPGTGSITITEYTGVYIKGTFQFTGYDPNMNEVRVTNGSFEGDL